MHSIYALNIYYSYTYLQYIYGKAMQREDSVSGVRTVRSKTSRSAAER
ncbi:MAG: hypothetical protein ACXWJX_09845 [Limisphaerales bacterium]